MRLHAAATRRPWCRQQHGAQRRLVALRLAHECRCMIALACSSCSIQTRLWKPLRPICTRFSRRLCRLRHLRRGCKLAAGSPRLRHPRLLLRLSTASRRVLQVWVRLCDSLHRRLRLVQRVRKHQRQRVGISCTRRPAQLSSMHTRGALCQTCIFHHPRWRHGGGRCPQAVHMCWVWCARDLTTLLRAQRQQRPP